MTQKERTAQLISFGWYNTSGFHPCKSVTHVTPELNTRRAHTLRQSGTAWLSLPITSQMGAFQCFIGRKPVKSGNPQIPPLEIRFETTKRKILPQAEWILLNDKL